MSTMNREELITAITSEIMDVLRYSPNRDLEKLYERYVVERDVESRAFIRDEATTTR